jgi:unsaturated pyranuronate lyase
MSCFGDLAGTAPYRIWDGIVARAIEGERGTLAVIELEPDTVVPEHAHENEQLGVLVAGSMRFRIGEEVRELEVGATWSIPANVPHEVASGPEGATAVEVFVPARGDWAALERREPSPPTWPVRPGRL